MKRLSALFLIIPLFVLFPTPAFAGLGISPGTIINDHLLPGTTYQSVLYLSRDTATKELFVSSTLLLPDANAWVTLEHSDQLHFAVGQHILSIPLSVHIPNNALEKQYRGTFYFHEKETTTSTAIGGTSKTALGTAASLIFTVTSTKIQEFMINSASIGTVYRPYPWGPFTWPGNLSANITIKNIGNTSVTPSKISLDIYNSEDKVILEHAEAFPPNVDAYATKNAEVIFPFHAVPGQYHGRIQIYNGYKPVTDQPIIISFVVPEEKNSTVIYYRLQQWATYIAGIAILCALAQILVFIHFQHAQYHHRKRHTATKRHKKER